MFGRVFSTPWEQSVFQRANHPVWVCWAYNEDGTVCGRPAVAVDAERGYTVCAQHASPRSGPGTTTPSSR